MRVAVAFTILAMICLAACALFTPDERADVDSLVANSRSEWIDAHRRGDVTKQELEEALARLDAIADKLKTDGTADLFWEYLLAFGAGAVGAFGSKPVGRGVRNVIATARRRREESAAKVRG